MPRGDLDLQWCRLCGLTTNVAFDASLLSYGADYENTQTASPYFADYVDELVRALVDAGVRKQRVLEVGCGKGGFLRRLCSAGNNDGLGFDPSYVGPEQEWLGRIQFRRELFDPDSVDEPVDTVVCRHVVEHVPDPARLIRSVKRIVRSDGLVVFETPALEWILDGVVFWDFFYEHCGYFTETALANLFRLSGFRVVDMRTVFDGQYLVITARPTSSPQPLARAKAAFADTLVEYQRREAERLQAWSRFIERQASEGQLAVWGAGAKGVTFLNLLDPGACRIACAVDMNPAKQGHHIPGTGHRVIAPEDLGVSRVESAIIMNPNYLAETQQLVQQLGINLKLLPAT